jgi:hypothetical protein
MPKVIDVKSTRYTGTWPQQLGTPEKGSKLGELRTAGEMVAKIVRSFLAEKPEILNDRDLSDEGRRKMLASVAETAVEKVEFYRGTVNGALDDAAKAERDLAESAVDISDEVVSAIRETEIRTALRSLDDSARREVVRRASDDGDFEVLRAVVAAPKSLQLVPNGIQRTVEETLLRGTNPERLQRARDLRLAAEYASEALDLARAAIIREGGIEPTLADRVRSA